MPGRLRSGFATALLLSLALPPPAGAQAPEARLHFRSGLARAKEGDLPAALREFEAAFAAQPHFSVLFNIAQTNLTLGRPVEAAAAFERYLALGGAQVSDARQAEVQTLLSLARGRIGQLRVTVNPPGARVRSWLDGRELAPGALAAEIDVASGEHHLLVAFEDAPPHTRSISVEPGKVSHVRVDFDLPRQVRDAQLRLLCPVPMNVLVGDGVRLTTPVAEPVLVPAGTITVKFWRDGYVGGEQTVIARSGAVVVARCNHRRARSLAVALSARLAVRSAPRDADVLIDGERFLGAALPGGLHHVRVEREGFLTHERLIFLSPGKSTELRVALAPTPEAAERARRASRSRKNVGLSLGIGGLATITAGAALYAWNSGRYRDWRDRRDQPADAAVDTATSIQRFDDASIGLLLLGAGLTAGGSWLFFGAE